MWMYILRRILYVIPIIIAVNLLTFALFFAVNSPDDIARVHLGGKYVTEKAKQDWKVVHGYDLPLFYNSNATHLNKFTETIFFKKSIKLFVFDFGISDTGRDIVQSIKERYLPSVLLALPQLILGLMLNISLALILTFFRDTTFDFIGVFICVMLLSISILFFIIAGQFIFAKIFKWFPISGYSDGIWSIQFLILPIIVAVFASIGAQVRWYRTLFLEEMDRDYVKTAIAKGLSNRQILFKHVLSNALIPIVTGVVAILPLLFLGSLLLESFFAIPGLGSYTIDAIREQDFAIVRSMVFLGTVLYIFGLIMTDITYAIVDPRVRLQ